MNNLIIGDVHGCGLELRDLIKKVKDHEEIDEIILVGDVFDRGLHTNIVWEQIQEHKIKVVRGNHEQKMLNWINHVIAGEKAKELPRHYLYALNKLASYLDLAELQNWLQNLPLFLEYDDYIVVHAGYCEHTREKNDLKKMLRKFVYGNFADIPFWDQYKGKKIVFYGHEVCENNFPRIKINSIGLDTAAVHGGRLTGAVVGRYPSNDIKIRYYSIACCDWFSEMRKLDADLLKKSLTDRYDILRVLR